MHKMRFELIASLEQYESPLPPRKDGIVPIVTAQWCVFLTIFLSSINGHYLKDGKFYTTPYVVARFISQFVRIEYYRPSLACR